MEAFPIDVGGSSSNSSGIATPSPSAKAGKTTGDGRMSPPARPASPPREEDLDDIMMKMMDPLADVSVPEEEQSSEPEFQPVPK